MLGALRTLSETSPVVIAIDDVQWVDGSSARALSFAMRRLAGHPLAVLATRRLEPSASEGLDLVRAIGDRDAVRMHVGPLAVDEVAHILRDRGSRPLTPPLVARVHEAAHGNPFFSLEILHALRDADPAAGRPLPVPGDALDALRARSGSLSATAGEVVLVMAAMARPTLRTLRASSDEPSTVDASLVEAEEAGLVAVDRERIDFVHPLMRSTVYWSASPGQREAVHARIVGATVDHEERARHMALMGAGPDPDRAAFVQEAAGHARRRGAPLAAAELWELSADLTPPDDEALLCSRTRYAALERFDAGDVRRGRAMLEKLIGTSTSSHQRAWTRLELAVRSYNDIDRVDELIRMALPDAGDHEIRPHRPREPRLGCTVPPATGTSCRTRPNRGRARRARRGIDPAARRARSPRRGRGASWGETHCRRSDAQPRSPKSSLREKRFCRHGVRGQQMLWEGKGGGGAAITRWRPTATSSRRGSSSCATTRCPCSARRSVPQAIRRPRIGTLTRDTTSSTTLAWTRSAIRCCTPGPTSLL